MAVFLFTAFGLLSGLFIESASGNPGYTPDISLAYAESLEVKGNTRGYLKNEGKEATPPVTVKNEPTLPGALLSPSANEIKEKKVILPPEFTLPTTGINWGELHGENAIDIANACGTPVFASAEGIVVTDPNYGAGQTSWNGGYGIFVLLEHKKEVKTRYAHLQKSVVRVGEYLNSGNLLGYIGNTGNVHGETGCHLHFEVLGAPNPFAR